MFFDNSKNGPLFANPAGMLKDRNNNVPQFHSHLVLKEKRRMARPKGSKAKHTRDNTLTLVRLTAGEKRQVKKNAGTANMTVAAFVRARILPEVDGREVLTDPIPGGRLTVKRSALTTALQRIAVNLGQLESYVQDLGDMDLIDDLGELRTQFRSFLSDHLESDPKTIEGRAGWTDELNELGKQLNRITRGANVRGDIARPGTLKSILVTISGVVDSMTAGEGAPK